MTGDGFPIISFDLSYSKTPESNSSYYTSYTSVMDSFTSLFSTSPIFAEPEPEPQPAIPIDSDRNVKNGVGWCTIA